jgi:rifampicin phosphotransferase
MEPVTEINVLQRVVELDAAEACEHELVGGKGANLGQLAQAGFTVPPAFIVTTEAYSLFLREGGITEAIAERLSQIDYDDVASLEARTAEIRGAIDQAEVPEQVQQEIEDAYGRRGTDRYVAVRSSGTAEDLAGASFAGLHDTYLDVRGAEALLDAVKRCWGSLWSARATMYRQRNGFEHLDARIAVVVQDMVESEVSGVMFTGNPRTAATDETVIDASWGLGEAIVQGIVTPDEYVVKWGILLTEGEPAIGSRHPLERTLGSKEKRFVRDPETGQGTVIEDVPSAQRAEYALEDSEVAALAELGRRVTEHYDGYPQDIEWALAGGTLYLLQSRPITGVEFSWDADINANMQITSFRYPPEDPMAIRTRAMADEAWTGGITPLMFSWRGNQWNQVFWEGAQRIGREDLLARVPVYYYKGYAYWDCEFELGFHAEAALPMSRPASIGRLPSELHERALTAKFGLLDWVRQMARSKLLRGDLGPYGWFKQLENYISNRCEEADGLPDSELPLLSDSELEKYTEQQIMFEEDYNRVVCIPGFFLICRDSMAALMQIVERWYDGDDPHVFTHLVTGTPKTTITIREHIELFKLSRIIRNSSSLSDRFARHHDGAFFEGLRDVEDAGELVDGIDAFLEMSGHRGHADRDIYYPRYRDDPSVLYAALEAHLKSDDDPLEQERRNSQIRGAAYEDVLASLRKRPLGFLKVEAFKIVHEYVMTFLMYRDNERWLIDRNTYSIRKALVEVGRRLVERGQLESERDFWFLGWHELFDLLHGRTTNMKLIRWKIEGRMRNFDRWDQKLISMPRFIQRNRPLDEGASDAGVDAEGRRIMRGFGTSSGEITATARVIRSLKDIGRVNKGEILIANSTDPGWTPVFAVISGVIVETGGLLSHSGCLAREYGFPAAHIEGVVATIPDGATITLNGDGGWVRVEPDDAADQSPVGGGLASPANVNV